MLFLSTLNKRHLVAVCDLQAQQQSHEQELRQLRLKAKEEASQAAMDLEKVPTTLTFSTFQGKWQQKFLSSYLKETPKQYIEVYYRILISALFREIF